MKRSTILLFCLSLVIVVSACQRRNIQPTLQPSLTPTPRSTSLPAVPTPIPVGAARNPIHIAFPIRESARSERAIQDAVDDLEAAILDETGFVVVVDRVESDAEAVAALCDSVDGSITVAWLHGIAYAAAEAQNCGTAALQVERAGSTTERAILIVNNDSTIDGVAGLEDANFCRVSVTDFYSWLMPSIIMASNGFSPADLGSVTNYPSTSTLLDEFANGNCDVAGVSESEYEGSSASSDTRELSGVGVPVPIGILTYPEVFPLGQRDTLTEAMIAIGNGTRGTLLFPLLEQDGIVEVDSGDLSAVRNLMNRAGVDLAAMGS